MFPARSGGSMPDPGRPVPSDLPGDLAPLLQPQQLVGAEACPPAASRQTARRLRHPSRRAELGSWPGAPKAYAPTPAEVWPVGVGAYGGWPGENGSSCGTEGRWQRSAPLQVAEGTGASH